MIRGLQYFVEQIASGAAMFGANGDGLLDLYFPRPKRIGACRSDSAPPLEHRPCMNDGHGKFTLAPDAFGGVDNDGRDRYPCRGPRRPPNAPS